MLALIKRGLRWALGELAWDSLTGQGVMAGAGGFLFGGLGYLGARMAGLDAGMTFALALVLAAVGLIATSALVTWARSRRGRMVRGKGQTTSGSAPALDPSGPTTLVALQKNVGPAEVFKIDGHWLYDSYIDGTVRFDGGRFRYTNLQHGPNASFATESETIAAVVAGADAAGEGTLAAVHLRSLRFTGTVRPGTPRLRRSGVALHGAPRLD